MECTDCGVCCASAPVIPVAKGDVIAPEAIDANGNLKIVEGHCHFFDPKTRHCTNYLNRPVACRQVAKGSDACLTFRYFARIDHPEQSVFKPMNQDEKSWREAFGNISAQYVQVSINRQ